MKATIAIAFYPLHSILFNIHFGCVCKLIDILLFHFEHKYHNLGKIFQKTSNFSRQFKQLFVTIYVPISLAALPCFFVNNS